MNGQVYVVCVCVLVLVGCCLVGQCLAVCVSVVVVARGWRSRAEATNGGAALRTATYLSNMHSLGPVNKAISVTYIRGGQAVNDCTLATFCSFIHSFVPSSRTSYSQITVHLFSLPFTLLPSLPSLQDKTLEEPRPVSRATYLLLSYHKRGILPGSGTIQLIRKQRLFPLSLSLSFPLCLLHPHL